MSLFRFLFLSAALLHGHTQDKQDTLFKAKLHTHIPPPPFVLNCNLVVEKHVNSSKPPPSPSAQNTTLIQFLTLKVQDYRSRQHLLPIHGHTCWAFFCLVPSASRSFQVNELALFLLYEHLSFCTPGCFCTDTKSCPSNLPSTSHQVAFHLWHSVSAHDIKPTSEICCSHYK